MPCWKRIVWLHSLLDSPPGQRSAFGEKDGVVHWGQVRCDSHSITVNMSWDFLCSHRTNLVWCWDPAPPPLRWVLLLGPSYWCFHGASRIPQRVPRNSGGRHHGFLLIYSLPNLVMFPAPLSLSEERNWLFLLRYRCRESQSHPLLGLGLNSSVCHHSISRSQSALDLSSTAFRHEKPKESSVPNRNRQQSSWSWNCRVAPNHERWHGMEFLSLIQTCHSL